MAAKLYIGSLAYATTDDSLRNYFATAGNVVSASVIMDKMTGRSRGFGFVEMGSEQEAQDAIAKFDGTELDGRTIRVSVAQAKERTGGNGGGGFRGGNRY